MKHSSVWQNPWGKKCSKCTNSWPARNSSDCPMSSFKLNVKQHPTQWKNKLDSKISMNDHSGVRIQLHLFRVHLSLAHFLEEFVSTLPKDENVIYKHIFTKRCEHSPNLSHVQNQRFVQRSNLDHTHNSYLPVVGFQSPLLDTWADVKPLKTAKKKKKKKKLSSD